MSILRHGTLLSEYSSWFPRGSSLKTTNSCKTLLDIGTEALLIMFSETLDKAELRN
jgi:hypothetical protein